MGICVLVFESDHFGMSECAWHAWNIFAHCIGVMVPSACFDIFQRQIEVSESLVTGIYCIITLFLKLL